jgi:hypothetical protein
MVENVSDRVCLLRVVTQGHNGVRIIPIGERFDGYFTGFPNKGYWLIYDPTIDSVAPEKYEIPTKRFDLAVEYAYFQDARIHRISMKPTENAIEVCKRWMEQGFVSGEEMLIPWSRVIRIMVEEFKEEIKGEPKIQELKSSQLLNMDVLDDLKHAIQETKNTEEIA